MQSPWRVCHLPGAMRPVPKHGLGVSRVPSAGTRSQPFPWQAQEQRAGYHQPQCQDHACPQGPGCPRNARAVGGISLGTREWQGRGQVAWAQVLSQVQPPCWIPAPTDTVHQAFDAIWGDQESASVPTAGSALRPWQCLLLAALGCRRAPPDSQLRVR